MNLAKSEESVPKDELEQKRNILKSLKDFDFQIKKNQEDIEKISEKIDFLTKDLDDLVSLYEIVSEQMNPFVGLSKVTKKRLDSLENFTKEVETIKEHVSDLESTVEKNLTNIQNYQSAPKQPKIKENPENESHDSTEIKPEQTEIDPDKETTEQITDEKTSEETKNTKNDETTSTKKPSIETPEQKETITPEVLPTVTLEPQISPPIQSDMPTNSYNTNEEINTSIIDEILTSSFEFFLMEQNIDVLIDEYLHTLK